MAVLTSTALTGITTRMADASMSAGSILQVVTTHTNSHLSSTSTSYVDLTDVAATITPTATSSKILITCSIAISKQDGHSFVGRIVKDGSAISGAGGVHNGNNTSQLDGAWWMIRTTDYSSNQASIQYLDSPSSTSAITYKAQGMTTHSSYPFCLNRTNQNGNQSWDTPAVSSMTLMEVAA